MQESLKLLPDNSGVYRFYDSNSRLLYVGKAKNLKNRVKSYFKFTPEFGAANDVSVRIAKMLFEAKTIEWTITTCEADALILENSLIKQLHPKYNILLRDDKTYPYIVVDYNEKFPRLEITRKTIDGGRKKYYGPFVGSARELLNVIYEKYQLVQKRSCAKGKKACLFYQIERCLAPCQYEVDEIAYKKILDDAVNAIFEKKPLLDFLENKMQNLALNERYEEAAEARDAFFAIKNMSVQSGIDLAKNSMFDAIAIVNENENGVIVRAFIRNGKVTSISHSFIKHFDEQNLDEAYRASIIDFYREDLNSLTKEIVVANEFDGMDSLASLISERFTHKVSIASPKIGEKKSIIEFLKLNGAEVLRKTNEKADITKRIKSLFELDFTPSRIEVFDASHLGGKNPVAAMVVWDGSDFDRANYRTYHVEGADEYSQMRETLTRRALDFENNPPPDLWLIDGGEAQRKLAQDIIDSSGAFVSVASIAKAKSSGRANRAKGMVADRIFYKNGEIKLPSTDARLQFLQRLRDESHRFVLNFQRKTRNKENKQISLMKEAGVSVGVVQKLIAALGSFEAIKEAKEDVLISIVGQKATNKILDYYSTEI